MRGTTGANVDINSFMKTAALMIVAHHDGAEGAIKWVADAGYTTTDLDSDGKRFLLANQLQLGQWSDAEQTVGALSGDDFSENPILYRLTALTTLISAVPFEIRADGGCHI